MTLKTVCAAKKPSPRKPLYIKKQKKLINELTKIIIIKVEFAISKLPPVSKTKATIG